MSLKVFPKLFKKNSQGGIEEWLIEVDANSSHGPATIKTTHGQLGGKMQETSDVIKEGKNAGKKNATTALEQAASEAQSKWEKKLKSGYCQTLEAAQSGEVDAIVEGGIVPMLAHSYDKSGEKIKYPCAVQPKLDGIRCIAIKKDSEVTLWTRTRKPITSCPHIIEAIKTCFFGDIVLDGELYNHDLKNDFEKIVSAVRKEEPSPESTLVQYHVYDCISEGSFETRQAHIILTKDDESEYIKIVHTHDCPTEEEVPVFTTSFISQGYEGAMLRNLESLYENKRSYGLQKVKRFDDKEFEIVGVNEGRGKLAGHAATFTCKTESGETFEAKMMGSTEKLKEYLNDHSLWQGKKLTVKYQGITNKNLVPRFPVGVAVRDYE